MSHSLLSIKTFTSLENTCSNCSLGFHNTEQGCRQHISFLCLRLPPLLLFSSLDKVICFSYYGHYKTCHVGLPDWASELLLEGCEDCSLESNLKTEVKWSQITGHYKGMNGGGGGVKCNMQTHAHSHSAICNPLTTLLFPHIHCDLSYPLWQRLVS